MTVLYSENCSKVTFPMEILKIALHTRLPYTSYKGESKVLQYFVSMWYNLAATDDLAKVVKVTTLNCEMPSPLDTLSATSKIYRYGLEQSLNPWF